MVTVVVVDEEVVPLRVLLVARCGHYSEKEVHVTVVVNVQSQHSVRVWHYAAKEYLGSDEAALDADIRNVSSPLFL